MVIIAISFTIISDQVVNGSRAAKHKVEIPPLLYTVGLHRSPFNLVGGNSGCDLEQPSPNCVMILCHRESMEPLFEGQDFSFTTHSVFLDSSNTPLPLAFDTFPLGGNVLHVRGTAVFP